MQSSPTAPGMDGLCMPPAQRGANTRAPRELAKVEGIEPPTRGFGDRCSTTELHFLVATVVIAPPLPLWHLQGSVAVEPFLGTEIPRTAFSWGRHPPVSPRMLAHHRFALGGTQYDLQERYSPVSPFCVRGGHNVRVLDRVYGAANVAGAGAICFCDLSKGFARTAATHPIKFSLVVTSLRFAGEQGACRYTLGG